MSCNVGDCEEKTRMTLCKFFKYSRDFKRPEHEIVLDLYMARLIAMLNPSSQFSFDRFGHEFLKLYKHVRATVKQILNSVDGKISLSVDVLSLGNADNKNGSEYMCLAAHLIDHKWTMRRFVLDFSPLGGEGNDSPSKIILSSLEDWEIKDKLLTITMVNGSLYDEMFKAVRDDICKSPLNCRPSRVYCCADMVKNLVVQDAYESISETLDKIKDMHSFKDALPTWENKRSHLKAAIPTEESGDYAGIPYGNISKKDWREVSDICDLVEKVYDLVFPLFENGYQPANVFLCNLHEAQFNLNQIDTDSNSFIKAVATKMEQKLGKYVKEMHVLMGIASIMDPRLKMKYIEFLSSRAQGSDCHDRMAPVMLKGSVTSHYIDQYAAHDPIEVKVSGDGAPKYLQEYTRLIPSTSSNVVKSELESYLEEPVLARRCDFNALTWWRVEGSYKYPILSRMARDFLAIPFTTAVGDDALMIEQRKVDPLLVSIEPNMAKALMCIRSWLLNPN